MERQTPPLQGTCGVCQTGDPGGIPVIQPGSPPSLYAWPIPGTVGLKMPSSVPSLRASLLGASGRVRAASFSARLAGTAEDRNAEAGPAPVLAATSLCS